MDNSKLLPRILPDGEVLLEQGYPDWEKSLIIVQFRIEKVTPEGTFQSAVGVLDHCARLGVNGIWLNPVYERSGSCGPGNNGYGNKGVHTIHPPLTGKKTVGESLAVIRAFVDEAHKRNIRIFFDAIVWGTCKDSPLVAAHPEYYLHGEAGELVSTWGGWAWDWSSRALRDYYVAAAARLIVETGADGFRVDLAPDTSGYFFREVIDECARRGRKILVISECLSRHEGAFHLDQVSVGWGAEPFPWDDPDVMDVLRRKYGSHSETFLRFNIVDCVKSGNLIGSYELQEEGKGGTLRYYTFNLLTHDDPAPAVRGSRLRFAYQALYAPFIPMWFLGEEWNNPDCKNPDNGVMYFNDINWEAALLPENAAFLDDIRRHIRIRRENAAIFEYFPDNARHANIEKVDSAIERIGQNPLQAYARYRDGCAVLIIPNPSGKPREITVTPDYGKIGIGPAARCDIADLFTGETFFEGAVPEQIVRTVPPDDVGVYRIRAL